MVIHKQFTKEQKHMVIQCLIDCELFGLSDKEGMKYIEEKTGRAISLTSYHRYKKIALNDNAANAWIDHFAKIGIIDHYRKRITEMEILQKNSYRLLHSEQNKKPEEQDKKYIISLLSEIRQNNIHLSQMAMGMPIIAKIKEVIEGGEYNSKLLELNGIRDQPFLSSSSSSSSSKEIINVNQDNDDGETGLSEGELAYRRQKEQAVF
jgi:hypothetical protein